MRRLCSDTQGTANPRLHPPAFGGISINIRKNRLSIRKSVHGSRRGRKNRALGQNGLTITRITIRTIRTRRYLIDNTDRISDFCGVLVGGEIPHAAAEQPVHAATSGAPAANLA